MNLFVRGFFASIFLLAGLMFTGCEPLPDDTGSQGSPTMPDSNSTNLVDVARFHVGDTVSVVFSGIDNLSDLPPHEETIKEDGNITLPLIGAVHAEGKTAGELQNEIHDLYVPKYYVRLTVTVKAGDLVYYVSGEVNGAGPKIYVSGTTVTKAIDSAQGLNDFASHKVILIRANGQRVKINYDDALGDPSKDLPVYPGDQINVPRKLW